MIDHPLAWFDATTGVVYVRLGGREVPLSKQYADTLLTDLERALEAEGESHTVELPDVMVRITAHPTPVRASLPGPSLVLADKATGPFRTCEHGHKHTGAPPCPVCEAGIGPEATSYTREEIEAAQRSSAKLEPPVICPMCGGSREVCECCPRCGRPPVTCVCE